MVKEHNDDARSAPDLSGLRSPVSGLDAITPEQLQELHANAAASAELPGLAALSADLTGAHQSPWEPACVAHAFRTPRSKIVFTMQVWIDLEACRSPLLQFEPLANLEEIEWAIDAFRLEIVEGITAEEGCGIAENMRLAVMDGFAMRLEMTPTGESTEAAGGFGQWLPLLSCLITQVGMSRAEALQCPVGQMFPLIAAMRRNDGWSVGANAYALRDIPSCL